MRAPSLVRASLLTGRAVCARRVMPCEERPSRGRSAPDGPLVALLASPWRSRWRRRQPAPSRARPRGRRRLTSQGRIARSRRRGPRPASSPSCGWSAGGRSRPSALFAWAAAGRVLARTLSPRSGLGAVRSVAAPGGRAHGDHPRLPKLRDTPVLHRRERRGSWPRGGLGGRAQRPPAGGEQSLTASSRVLTSCAGSRRSAPLPRPASGRRCR